MAQIDKITENSNQKTYNSFISTRNIQYFDIFSTKFKMHFSDILIITLKLHLLWIKVLNFTIKIEGP